MITGQIGVVHGPRPWTFGALVAAVTKSTAYHVIVAVSETHCVSPEKDGAILQPIDHFANVAWSRFDYTDAQRQGVVDWVTARLGRPYSWFDDAVIGVHKLTGLPIPTWLGRLMSNDRSYMCSELAACAVFFGAGIRPFPTQYPGEVSPADWDTYLTAQGWDTPAVTTTA